MTLCNLLESFWDCLNKKAMYTSIQEKWKTFKCNDFNAWPRWFIIYNIVNKFKNHLACVKEASSTCKSQEVNYLLKGTCLTSQYDAIKCSRNHFIKICQNVITIVTTVILSVQFLWLSTETLQAIFLCRISIERKRQYKSELWLSNPFRKNLTNEHSVNQIMSLWKSGKREMLLK